MNGSSQHLKAKVIFSLSTIIVLILCSGALAWVITQRIEQSERTTDTAHMFKEAELQLRREEKNLLIRGYSAERFHRWQEAKGEFYQKLGELIGQKAVSDVEIAEFKSDNSEMSDAYRSFFDDIKSGTLTETEAAAYDLHFKTIGQRSIGRIDSILAREESISKGMDSRANLLTAVFFLVFIGTTSFLVINVLRSL